MVEHSTADREVPGSNPGAPWITSFINRYSRDLIPAPRPNERATQTQYRVTLQTVRHRVGWIGRWHLAFELYNLLVQLVRREASILFVDLYF